MSFNEIPSPSEERRPQKVSLRVDPCEGMAKPAAGDASDSQHGLCECGCGQQTNLITHNNAHHGEVAGTYRPYATGHSVRARWLNHVKPVRNKRVKRPDYIVDPETGCWVWQRAKGRNGYGHLYVGQGRGGGRGKQVYAHRAYYERHIGPIPEGLTIDHLCRNKLCVNPDHLEVVTLGENCRRAHLIVLPEAAITEILTSELSSRKLALKFGVSHRYIGGIRNGTHRSVAG